MMSSIRLQHYDVTSCKQRHLTAKHNWCKGVINLLQPQKNLKSFLHKWRSYCIYKKGPRFFETPCILSKEIKVPCFMWILPSREFTWNIESYFLWKRMKKYKCCLLQSWLALKGRRLPFQNYCRYVNQSCIIQLSNGPGFLFQDNPKKSRSILGVGFRSLILNGKKLSYNWINMVISSHTECDRRKKKWDILHIKEKFWVAKGGNWCSQGKSIALVTLSPFTKYLNCFILWLRADIKNFVC